MDAGGHHGIMEGGGMATGMAGTATRLTYDDLAALPQDGLRHELIDGEHLVSPSPLLRHQAVVVNLTHLLVGLVRAKGLGKIYSGPVDVVFSPHDVVVPDLVFVSAARVAVLTPANIQGAPDLAVEVLSPSNRRWDEIRKRDLYERAGVAEYWIVDPEAETVKVLRRLADGAGFGRAELLSAHQRDVLSSPLLPGLEVPVSELFAE
jgi:Uma2 family endonuclease